MQKDPGHSPVIMYGSMIALANPPTHKHRIRRIVVYPQSIWPALLRPQYFLVSNFVSLVSKSSPHNTAVLTSNGLPKLDHADFKRSFYIFPNGGRSILVKGTVIIVDSDEKERKVKLSE